MKIQDYLASAVGQMNRDSDIDLLVVAADPGDQRKESIRLRKMLRGSVIPPMSL